MAKHIDPPEPHSPEAVRASWDTKAEEWHAQVGEDGDRNRRWNSDPVLWRMLGDVAGQDVLDAGCGTGYLAVKLVQAGAQVRGIDWSEKMVAVARRQAAKLNAKVNLHVDSVSEMKSVPDTCVDAVVSNYVLMDAPDLDGASRHIARVLRPGCRAVLVICHPCFDNPSGPEDLPEGGTRYLWPFSYFDEEAFQIQWGPFATPFWVHHRPLSRYWKSFTNAGLRVDDFDEPILPSPPPPHIDAEHARRSRMHPCSVAFKCVKPG